MSGSERRKGAGGELEVARIFQSHGFDCDRTPNSGGLRIRGDLHGNLPLHVEVKRQETARPWLWAKQARADAGDGERWLVAMRRSHDEWLAMLPLAHLLRLLELELLVGELKLSDTVQERELLKPHVVGPRRMTQGQRCHYCGMRGSRARRVGEPPTCSEHADLPRLDDADLVSKQLELELERELRLHQRDGAPGGYREE